MRFTRPRWLVLMFVFTLLGCGGIPRGREGWIRRSAEDAERMRIERGRGLFLGHCASCHGGDARGRGPVAAVLKVPPSDLTRIAARRSGRFEPGEVAAFIDGRFEVAAHGRREMPVWGRVYDDRAPAQERLLSASDVSAITTWLKLMQVTGP